MCEQRVGALRIAVDASKCLALSRTFRVAVSAVSVALGAWFLWITPVTVPALVLVLSWLVTVAAVTAAVVMWRRSRAPASPWAATRPARRPIAAIEAPKARVTTIDELLRETA